MINLRVGKYLDFLPVKSFLMVFNDRYGIDGYVDTI